MKSGEYHASTEDLLIRGRVLTVQIARTYGSRREHNYGFGYGWDMNYNIRVRDTNDPDILILRDGENRGLEYTLVPGSDPKKYKAPAGYYRYDFLVEDPNGTYTLFKKHGKKLEFNTDGNLSAIRDRNNNSITFGYDPIDPNRLSTITDDLGREVNLSYNASGLLSSVADFADRIWTYTYDSATNDLLTVTGPNTTDYPNGLTTTYAYDGNHNLVTITDPNGQTYLTITYDANDMVQSQTYGGGNYALSYIPDSNEAMVTDRSGFNTVTIYNSMGCAVSRTIYTKGLRDGDPNSYTTTYERNSDMEITRETFPAGNYIDYTFDSNGNLLSISREPNNGEPNIVTTYTYESKFNFVKTITDPRGNVTTYTYDYEDPIYGTEAGNLMKITYPAVTTPNGRENPVVEFTYNEYGQVETTTALCGIACGNGPVRKYEYYNDANDLNNYGRLWKEIVDYNETDGLNITTEYKYDVVGNAIEVNDPNGNITRFAYNSLDQLTKVTSPLNYITNLSYNKCKKLSQIERVRPNDPNQITSYAYEKLGKLQTITDALGNVTTFGYDKNENKNLVTDAEGNSTSYVHDERNLLWKTTDGNGGVTECSYDLNGNYKQIKDARGNTTKYEYDGFDRLVKITYANESSDIFGYDAASNLISWKNRSDETIYYEYDALNRLIVKNRPGDPNITYLYDVAGRVVEVNDGGDVTEYSYDRIGRVSDVHDIENRVVSYEYDSRGLRTKLVYPDSSYITYEYDALSRLRRIKDQAGDVLAEYGYDELSRRTLLELDNDANAVYEYDLANRLTNLTNNFDGAGSSTIDYIHDKVGNRLTMTVGYTDEHSYYYDSLYQLTDVNYPDYSTVAYSYDKLGNRTSVVNGGTKDYSSNSLNQYASVGGTNYSYDDNGNLTYDGIYRYYYDCENRLTDVNDVSNQKVASYSYDYKGRRIERTVYGQTNITTKYCYDGAQVIAEYEDGALVRKFIYGPGIDEPIIMIDVAASKYYYYHFNGLGSVVALSDGTGQITEAYEYDVFGSTTIWDVANMEIAESSTVGNPFMFTGRRFDDETGLYYYRARMYAPYIGRFMQTDPVGYYDSTNLYLYCFNNPVNFIDPLGLCYIDINISIGWWGGVTFGIMIGPGGSLYGYIGGGFITPPGGGAVTVSPSSDPTLGWNAGGQLGFWGGGQVGYSFGECGDWFGEGGFVTPGASLTGYYVWDIWELEPEEDGCKK
ncbi:hypothetical protein DRN85_08035 [Methanosarcinales archaeon]|nr:MAG: hypothetical protein DRN85_08035 [Methanosarcinales archaeon]